MHCLDIKYIQSVFKPYTLNFLYVIYMFYCLIKQYGIYVISALFYPLSQEDNLLSYYLSYRVISS